MSSSIGSKGRLGFEIQGTSPGTKARAARFKTLHNEVLTPIFMPVGTRATVKAQLHTHLEDFGSQILLANTYHLLLRPGPEVFDRMGGIHGLMSWDRSVLTDSGGFQIFSLPHSRQMSEEGALFQSYTDGCTILLTPELSIATQKSINSDIMMVLDQCIPSTADHATAVAAMNLTHRWAQRSLDARGDSPQSMFGIIQGAIYRDLRSQSADILSQMPFDGFAIGGLAVGEAKSEREDLCEYTADLMPTDRPRYLMGVGTPIDLLEAVHRGVDMFDCILPTQLAQRGTAFTSRGILQLRRGVYRFAEEKLDPACGCPVCARYSRSYLHHLTKCKETLGWMLLGQHNIYFYHQLMREMREAILAGTFMSLYNRLRDVLDEEDLDHPPVHPKIRPGKRDRHKPKTHIGDYEVIINREGFGSIRQLSSGETMHPRGNPMDEAVNLYLEQSRLAEQLVVEDSSSIVIWDVGLGAATNAMAAVNTAERIYAQNRLKGLPLRPLKIISFENDLDSLRLAFENSDKFLYLRHGAPAGILKEGRWNHRDFPIEWTLVKGDFYDVLRTHGASLAKPDIIYYDLFSAGSEADHWTVEAFQSLFEFCQGRQVGLYTYSVSTAFRVAMLASGFFVARGRPSPPKSETTIGLTRELFEADSPHYELLAAEWLEKWNRSQAKFPNRLAEPERPGFERRIVGHAQFAQLRRSTGKTLSF